MSKKVEKVNRYQKVFGWIKSDPKLTFKQMASRLGNKFPAAAMQVCVALKRSGVLAGESGAWEVKGTSVPASCQYQPLKTRKSKVLAHRKK